MGVRPRRRRVIAAAWLRVIGGDPAFQGDPGLLLEILEILEI